MGNGADTGGERFLGYLEHVRPRIDEAVAGAIGDVDARGVSVDVAADLRRYLYGPLAGFVGVGGKRVRPALCLLGAEAVGGTADAAFSAAVAVELFQAAALVHDDIADRGTMRRGGSCLHVSEGVGVAVNVGDLALIGMYANVLADDTLSVATKHSVLLELDGMARRTAEGQALDIGWARDGRWDLTVDDYLYMATCKTAYYSAAAPLACGALCGDASPAQVGALRRFGLLAGLAFQLQDDLLNVCGDAVAQGKDYRSDITEGKRTMLVAHALSRLDANDAAELRGLLSSGSTDAADLARAVALMDSAGSISYVRAYAHDLVAEAKSVLDVAAVAPESSALLASMADFFVERPV